MKILKIYLLAALAMVIVIALLCMAPAMWLSGFLSAMLKDVLDALSGVKGGTK